MSAVSAWRNGILADRIKQKELIVFLDNKYSKENLKLDELNNTDRQRVELLQEGCAKAGCKVYLGNLWRFVDYGDYGE